MKMMLSEIAKVTNGTHVGADVEVASASIDTRAIQSGDLYIAIKGHQFDGNEFVEKAKQAGAAAAILNENFTSKLPHILVNDTRLALGQLAGAWRNKVSAKVVGITGSNGKTTVKEMTAAVLG
ncbi:MAG: UDP-N-acetylmuramoyl-tripeptide--D-alanyl-D-alanine ligase, partial [Methyloglobulus sp.]|nr:UDP-N-acetylmuramoyl-tripeptide--D-alanyl-D-alanine ligase [Methyloglobulus sp.]